MEGDGGNFSRLYSMDTSPFSSLPTRFHESELYQTSNDVNYSSNVAAPPLIGGPSQSQTLFAPGGSLGTINVADICAKDGDAFPMTMSDIDHQILKLDPRIGGDLDGSSNSSSWKSNKSKPRRRMREPRFCFQTRSDIDVLDDGYKRRKYGQKVVKNSIHPRSYYRCTNGDCRVKKRVKRLSEDFRMVITTYEGRRHTHDPPCPVTRQIHLIKPTCFKHTSLKEEHSYKILKIPGMIYDTEGSTSVNLSNVIFPLSRSFFFYIPSDSLSSN